MNQRYAAIDLGSNTFHILIAEKISDGEFKKIHQQREYVYLGRDGVEHINESSYKLGMETLSLFAELMKTHAVVDYRMTGTATLRNADNGQQFLLEVKEKFNLDIEIIDGMEEASLIYKGVCAYLPKPFGKYLIMDIGGGSVEFIYFDQEKMHYSESFQIGISILYNKFEKSDPISQEDADAARTFIRSSLQNLSKFLEGKQIDAMVGSAGSFDVITSIFETRFDRDFDNTFTRAEYGQIFKEIHPLSKNERMSYPGIPEARVVLIPIAMLLIDQLLSMFEIEKIIVSPFALKEGIISDFVS